MHISDSRTFGVEIELSEFANPAGRSMRNNTSDVFGWIGKGDGSLRGENTCELESPILRGNSGIDEIYQLFKEIEQTKTHTEANESCGIHVHVGLHDYKPHHLINLWRMMSNVEDMLFAMVKPERGQSMYCSKLRGNPFFATDAGTYAVCFQGAQSTARTPINGLANNAFFRHSPTRYTGVNLLDYNTRNCIEYRMHHGSANAREIADWSAFLVRLADFCGQYDGDIVPIDSAARKFYNVRRQVNYIKQLLDDEELGSYIVDRIRTFNDDPQWATINTEVDVPLLPMPEAPWGKVEYVGPNNVDYLAHAHFSSLLFEGVLLIGDRDSVHEKTREVMQRGLFDKIQVAVQELRAEWEAEAPPTARVAQVDGPIGVGSLVYISEPNRLMSNVYAGDRGIVTHMDNTIGNEPVAVIDFQSGEGGIFANVGCLGHLRSPLQPGEHWVTTQGERSSITSIEESFRLYRSHAA